MRKAILSAILLLSASMMWSQKPCTDINFIKQLEKGDTLKLFHTGGDMSFSTKGILVYKSKTACWVERHGDTIFVGTTPEPVWKQQLTAENIRKINRYMNDVRCLRKRVDASAVEYISATVNSDTLVGYAGQYCFGFALDKKLFEREYEQLEVKRRLRLDTLEHLFQGIYYPGTVTGDSAGQYLSLSREYRPETSYSPDCIWEFLPQRHFKNDCQNFNLKFSNDTFSIYYGKHELQMGFSMYEILEINPKDILLKNAYSYQKTPPRY